MNKKQIMQKVQAISSSKNPISRSFATDRSSSLLNQFLLKTKQTLLDDIKLRNAYQSFKPISHAFKGEIKEFMKLFAAKPKDQWIVLNTFLVDKYVDLANLKIYLWLFKEGKPLEDWQDAFPFTGLLDSFSLSFLSEQSPKSHSKTLQTQETRSIKPSLVHTDSFKTLEENTLSPPSLKLRKTETPSMQPQIVVAESTKDILRPLQKLFESLSNGDLEEALKQKFPASLGQSLRQKWGNFLQRSQAIKRTIVFMNSGILSSEKVTPEMNLKSLQKCLQKINKLQTKSKKNQTPTASGKGSNESQAIIQSLQLALSHAQKLFNDKSIQFSLQKMRSGKEMAEMSQKLRVALEQNSGLEKKIVQLEELRQREVLNMRQEHLSKLKDKTRQHESIISQLKEQMAKKKQVIEQLERQLEQSQKSTSLKERQQNLSSNKLNRTIDTLTLQNQHLKTHLQRTQAKLTNYELENNTLNLKLIDNSNQHLALKQALLQKISSLQLKQTSLIKQNQTLQESLNKITLSLKEVNEKIQKHDKSSQQILFRSLELISINSTFQSSDIIPPLSLNQLTQSLLSDSLYLTEDNRSKRRDILISKNLSALVQKEFLVNQIQNYVHRIDFPCKVKSFKLIFRHHHDLKTNFHEYIDDKPNFLILVKLRSGAVIGGYSHQPLKRGARTQLGFIFSLTLLQSYFLRQKHCVVYDQYYLIFGNSQMRIRIGQNTFYSNFGITKAYFQNQERTYTDFLQIQNDREQYMDHFQVYQVNFDTK